MVTRRDYISIKVDAALSVVIELMQLLGEYRDNIVLIGGWVPKFIIPEKKAPFIGSLDVDLALDHRKISEKGYKTIQELLLERGYEQGRQPFIFHRRFMFRDQKVSVQVDLLSGQYGGTKKGHRHQRVQGIFARKARGCDLAFEKPIELIVEGELPVGGKSSVKVRVASIVTFLVMKGMALTDRLKEKDAWDIYYCVKNYPGDLDSLANEFKPHIGNALIKEGLEKIKTQFASEGHVGPKFVADFEEVTDPEERALLQRDAYERVNYLLEKLGIL